MSYERCGAWVGALLSGWATVFVPSLARSSPPDPEARARYQELAATAIAEFDRGHWAEARALFLAAHRLWPSARTLRTLGMTAYELRDYPTAYRELEAALEDERRPLGPDLRDQVRGLLERTQAFIGTFRLQLRPEAAQLWINGEAVIFSPGEPLYLSVGSHQLRVSAPGHLDALRVLKVEGGEAEGLNFDLVPEGAAVPLGALPQPTEAREPASTPAFRPRWTWVAAGGAVAFGAASGLFWALSEEAFDDLRAECRARAPSTPCRPESLPDTGRLDTLETAHQVTLGVSVAAGVAAAVLLFVEREPPEAGLGLRVGPAGALFEARF